MTQTAAVPAVPAATDSMRDRVPAQVLLERVLLLQAAAQPRTRLDRMLGRDPVAAEARSSYLCATRERAVAARLAALPAGWTAWHSLPVGRSGADLDHLVVGPGGVFTLTTKHFIDASVWAAGRSVLVAGTGTAMVHRAEGEARRVDRIVARVLPNAPAAHPVVAIVGAKRVSVRRPVPAVSVVRAEHLRRFLRSRPDRLTQVEVGALTAVLDDPSTWQPTVEAGPELLLDFARLTREVRTAGRIRLGWALGLLGVTAAASSSIVLPGLLSLLAP